MDKSVVLTAKAWLKRTTKNVLSAMKIPPLIMVKYKWLLMKILPITGLYLLSAFYCHTVLPGSTNLQLLPVQSPPHGFYTWQGKINGSIPVFMWLKIQDSLIKGSLIYTSTKLKQPIQLLGRIDSDGDIRVFEFEKNGNITGVFVFDSIAANAKGTWAATKNDKQYQFELEKKDTLLRNADTSFAPVKISGEYSYSFGEEGRQGGVSIKQAGKNKIVFEMSSVTRAPARNIAQVEKNTVQVTSNQFIYKVPYSDSCVFKVKCCKNFLYISYLKGYTGCMGVFGYNATVEGIFIKTSR